MKKNRLFIPFLNITIFGRTLMAKIKAATPEQQRHIDRFVITCLIPGRLWFSRLK